MSYQQYFVVVALVIPVFFLAHVIQFRKFSKHAGTAKLTVLYGLFVLGLSVLGEEAALQFIWTTGLPTYSTSNMPWPDESLTAAKQWLLALVGALLFASLIPALAAEPRKKQQAAESDAPPPPEALPPGPPPSNSTSAGRTMMTVGLTALCTAALMIRGQRRQRVKKP